MTRRRRAVRLASAALVACVATAAAGCGGDSDDAAARDTQPPSTTTPVLAAMDRLAGRYAHYDAVAYEGNLMNAMIISYGFTDLDVVDGEMVAQESFCFSEFRSNQPIDVSFSDAATSAIKPVPTPTTITVKDGVAHMSRPETPTGIGIHLDDPANEALPADPNDPRIADDDRDGKPGVTATISTSGKVAGEIYLARREIFAYEADERPDGSLEGTVRDRSEQLVIGASNPVFAAQDAWVQHPDPAKSPIILRPVDRSTDCEQLRAQRDDLFPPTPSVDY